MELKLPEWASTPPAGYPGAIEPPAAKAAAGWANGEEPPAGTFNWVFQAIADVSNEIANAITGAGFALLQADKSQLGAALLRQGVKTAFAGLSLAAATGAGVQLNGIALRPRRSSGGTPSARTSVVVVVGASGKIWTSTSSGAFVDRSANVAAGFTGVFNDVVYDAGLQLFIAVGATGEIQTSTHGDVWTRARTGGNALLAIATDGAGHCVAVGVDNLILSSSNGTTWTTRTSPFAFTPDVQDVAFGAGAVCVISDGTDPTGVGSEIGTSLDNGATWTVSYHPGVAGTRPAIGYHPTIGFVAVYNILAAASSDGVTWASVNTLLMSEFTGNQLVVGPYCYAIAASVGSGGSEICAYHVAKDAVVASEAPGWMMGFATNEILRRLVILGDQLWGLGGAVGDKVFRGGVL
jgi:hypothetical protein